MFGNSIFRHEKARCCHRTFSQFQLTLSKCLCSTAKNLLSRTACPFQPHLLQQEHNDQYGKQDTTGRPDQPHHEYVCSSYRHYSRSCTCHYIRVSVVESLVLEALLADASRGRYGRDMMA